MPDLTDDLESARLRIRAAYSPELFATLADRWADTLTTHFRSVTAGDGRC
jgi:hypothetical protein